MHFMGNLRSRSMFTQKIIKRIIQDGDYVFAHIEFIEESEFIGFEVFRFQEYQIIEHWDNYPEKEPVKLNGRSMIDE